MSQEPLDSRVEHPEIDAVAEYPPVSRLAVLSLLLAIVACGAVFSPLLVCLAVAGALVAVAALWSIARAQRPPLGAKRPSPRCCSVCCSASGAQPGEWSASRWCMPRPNNRPTNGCNWCGPDACRKRINCTWRTRIVRPPARTLRNYYKNNRESRFDFESFFRGEPLRQIVEAGQRGSVRFLQCANLVNEYFSGQKTDVVTLRYALDSTEERPTARRWYFLLPIARKVASGGAEAHWELRGVQLPKK